MAKLRLHMSRGGEIVDALLPGVREEDVDPYSGALMRDCYAYIAPSNTIPTRWTLTMPRISSCDYFDTKEEAMVAMAMSVHLMPEDDCSGEDGA